MYPCMHKTLLKNYKEKNYHLEEREFYNQMLITGSKSTRPLKQTSHK